ncbi:MAG TPA: hypothetical protein VM557_03130, partial [Thermoanaerobaculia bacterium]|nr:hypothetical protein [Thermoanaerobaculia bacterium]
MSRIALLCPEPLGHGQPAGVGIRFIEMARVLIGAGHDVDVMSPDGGSPSGGRGVPLSPRAIGEVTAASDAVVAQGHVVNDFITFGADRPLVVDLYDPFIVENFHYWKERGSRVFEHDHETLFRSLRRGDFFLCASESQRLFYLGALLGAGRIEPDTFHDDPTLRGLIRIAPFGVPPPRRAPSTKVRSPHLFFGGIYDWYDPFLAIDAVAAARRRREDLTLTFTYHPNAATT